MCIDSLKHIRHYLPRNLYKKVLFLPIRRTPDKDTFKAFLLPVRFNVQDNENDLIFEISVLIGVYWCVCSIARRKYFFLYGMSTTTFWKKTFKLDMIYLRGDPKLWSRNKQEISISEINKAVSMTGYVSMHVSMYERDA